MGTKTTNTENTFVVKSARAIFTEYGSKLILKLDKELPCFKQDMETGIFTQSTTDEYNISFGVMCAMLSDMSDKLALLMSLPIEAVLFEDNFKLLSAKQRTQVLLTRLLIGSTFEITSELHSANEIIDGEPLGRDKYFNNIEKILLTKNAKDFIDEKAAIFGL